MNEQKPERRGDLVQLPDGTWVKAQLVDMITAHPESKLAGSGEIISGPRVVLYIRGVGPHQIPCSDLEHAEELRRDIATSLFPHRAIDLNRTDEA